MGNLARDPVIRATKTGRAVASFTVAVNRNYTTPQGEQKELTDWINVVAWGNLAESVGNQLKKGMRVFVEGRLSTRSYDTPEGQRRWVTEVVANFVALPLGNAHPSQPQGPFGASGKWVHRDLVPAALDNLGIPHREMRIFHSDKQLILEDKEPCLEKIEQEDREERSASAALIT